MVCEADTLTFTELTIFKKEKVCRISRKGRLSDGRQATDGRTSFPSKKMRRERSGERERERERGEGGREWE